MFDFGITKKIKKLEEIFLFFKKIYDYINLIIKYIFLILKIFFLLLAITYVYKIYKFLKRNSFKQTLNKIGNKISESIENITERLLFKIGIIRQLSEKQNDNHLREQIENEIIEDKLNVKFEDIVDLDEAKEIINESIFLPKYVPDFFKGLREPWKGILLFGPPGTGKTLLAKAIASQTNSFFFNVKSSSFSSKWVGESEKLVKLLFEIAREKTPSIIFIDEIDSIARKRDDKTPSYDLKTLNEFLIQMDGLKNNKNIFIVAATNRPFDIDDAILRRFPKAIYVPLPNKNGRIKMFKNFLKNNKYEENLDFDKIAEYTEGYNGSDIFNLCKESSFMILRKVIKENKKNFKNERDMFKNDEIKKKLLSPITLDDIMIALKSSKKSVSDESIFQCQKFLEKIKGNK